MLFTDLKPVIPLISSLVAITFGKSSALFSESENIIKSDSIASGLDFSASITIDVNSGRL
jgi:hypothetical protein